MSFTQEEKDYIKRHYREGDSPAAKQKMRCDYIHRKAFEDKNLDSELLCLLLKEEFLLLKRNEWERSGYMHSKEYDVNSELFEFSMLNSFIGNYMIKKNIQPNNFPPKGSQEKLIEVEREVFEIGPEKWLINWFYLIASGSDEAHESIFSQIRFLGLGDYYADKLLSTLFNKESIELFEQIFIYEGEEGRRNYFINRLLFLLGYFWMNGETEKAKEYLIKATELIEVDSFAQIILRFIYLYELND